MMVSMELINDFLVDSNQERWVGIVVIVEKNSIWIFEDPVHGCDVYFGNNPKEGIGRNWSQ